MSASPSNGWLARQWIVAFLLIIPAAAAQESRPAVEPASFAGIWQTTFGEMRCTQTADQVSGTYDFSEDDPGRINGRVEGRKLTFRYQDSDGEGEGWFQLAADGHAFAGQWRKDGSEWDDWTGKRGGESSDTKTFSGLWKTRFGPMRLQAVGDEIVGTYAYAGISNIRGKLEGGKLRFQYDQPDGERGSGEFELADGGARFDGSWKSSAGGGGTWIGTRIVPVPGRVWLVVLESNWEGSLAEHEYSYGQMLRSFFTRLPNVQVRHRFVHSAADFQRYAAEVAYFAEPVVLYISSHGTSAGVVLGSEIVGAEALNAGLRGAGSLRLLHFGSCEVLSSDVPAKIAAARPSHERFPISGFSKTADWAGSAIVDFTYLELVIGKNMPPEKAVQATRKMVTFARENSHGAIPGSGLKVYAGPEAGAALAGDESDDGPPPATRPSGKPADTRRKSNRNR